MRDTNFPHEAIAIIDEVLQLGRDKKKYPNSFWRTLSVMDHVNSAKAHLNDFIYGIKKDEDDLAHALTRLAMAISVRESGQRIKTVQEIAGEVYNKAFGD